MTTSPLENCTYFLPSTGCLHLTGPDRIAFLQRQTTNDVTKLASDRAVTTVLTSATARILDVLQLFEDGETIGVLPLPGRADSTFTYLRRRIFFNDHVTLTNTSDEFPVVDLEGEKAGDWLREQGLEPPPLDGVTPGTLADTPVRIIGQPGLTGIGYRVLASSGNAGPLLDHLSRSNLSPLPSPLYEILRIEAGLPAAGHELTEDFTPHETNLAAWVNDTKGCYTGQEILARQVTYDKITRHMVGLNLNAPAQSGANVLAEGKPAGTITSAVISPRLGPIALAILKRPFHEPGTPVTVDTGSVPINAIVSPLPFSK